MATKTITSANSILMLAIEGLYDAPVQLQGFAADNIFDTDTVAPAETVMGVDGFLSVGWAPVAVVQNISIMPDSPSNDIFETWYLTQQSQREAFVATGSVVLPSIGRKYAMTRGILSTYAPTPAAARVLQARRFAITWGAITSARV